MCAAARNGQPPRCGAAQSANFSASLVKNFGRQDKIYASVNRQFSTISGLGGHWEDDATVGFVKGFRRLTFTTDAGYLRGDTVTTVLPGYHGYFVAPRVRYKITNSMGATAGYRSFNGQGRQPGEWKSQLRSRRH